ncbi:MAG: 16S rRNA (cytidine1402-2'-O)-methyltransferase [Cyclobacteriaceae bacterium]|jgi:16S rRNA (cytidine1402-2'-O)-methyltransferase
MTKGRLFLIPTIISDETQEKVISQEVRTTIKGLNHFLVENIRTARRYISSLKLGINIGSLKFEVLDKSTSALTIAPLMKPILEGNDIGVISESGCPGVADPGALAVAFAHKNEIQVVPMVGPSSILLALMASGFNGQSFVFHGYLPIEKLDRQKKIKKMEEDAIHLDQTQLFMDTPYRNESLLEALLKTCNPNTQLSIARDITGKNELIRTKKIQDWKIQKTPGLNKIPVIFALYH